MVHEGKPPRRSARYVIDPIPVKEERAMNYRLDRPCCEVSNGQALKALYAGNGGLIRKVLSHMALVLGYVLP